MNIQSVSFNDITLVDVHDPKDLEIKHLIQEYNFSEVHLEDYIHRRQIPKIENHGDYSLVVLDFPFVDSPEEKVDVHHTHYHNHSEPNHVEENGDKKHALAEAITKPGSIPKLLFTQADKKRIHTGHINFFIGEKYLVVLHDDKTAIVDAIFSDIQKSLKNREEFMGRGPNHLFYEIVNLLTDATYKMMSQITTMIDEIDLKLLQDHSAISIVEDISVTRRNLVFFKSMIEPSLNIFSDLANHKFEQFENTPTDLWSSIYSQLQKIRYRLSSSIELVEGIARSHESLLTARTNEIVKVLTMFTAILLPLTFVTGIYGMNVGNLPLVNSEDILFVLSLIMVAIIVLMLVGFKIKKWI